MPRSLSHKESVYCPVCKIHSSQERALKRGTRYCGTCGETFTLRESRDAEAKDRRETDMPDKPPEKIFLPADTDDDSWNILAKNPTRNWRTGEAANNIEYILASAEKEKVRRQILNIVALKAPDGDCFCAAVPQKGQVHSVRCEYVREQLEAARIADKD